jgi:cytochrome c oxidase subunit 2
VRLASVDVIHSLWVPNLAGKVDLIPGRTNVLWLRPNAPGVYRAQCAEFCGLQHAHMALDVIVHAPAEFEAWLERQRQPAAAPGTAAAARGRLIVEQGSCAMCHMVAGTSAGGRTAPDLTHFASRRTIGAGTRPNDRAALSDWLTNPQHVKPGNRMPPPGLSAEDRDAVIAYLEQLR